MMGGSLFLSPLAGWLCGSLYLSPLAGWLRGSLYPTWLVLIMMAKCTTAMTHETIVLSGNLSGSGHQYFIDGATIMSQEYYNESKLFKSIIIMPRDVDGRLLIQFVYLDIPRQKPCRDFLHICEWNSRIQDCGLPVVRKFCGDLPDLIPGSKLSASPHFVATAHTGQGILIQWQTYTPIGYHRGFQIIVTAFVQCKETLVQEWTCGDDRCINNSLHCDGITHCTDGSDELINCSRAGFILPNECGVWRGGTCPPHRWRERWFGVAVPMIIVMALLLIAIIVRIRKQLCRPPPGSSRRRQRQRCIPRVLLPRSQACTLQPVVGAPGRPHLDYPHHPMYDMGNIMLLPPPYSPPECVQYGDPPTEGEPPPLYEECINSEEENLHKPSTPSESPEHVPHV